MGRAPARARGGRRSPGHGGVQECLQRAEMALAEDDYAAAVEALSRGVEKHPQASEVRFSRPTVRGTRMYGKRTDRVRARLHG